MLAAGNIGRHFQLHQALHHQVLVELLALLHGQRHAQQLGQRIGLVLPFPLLRPALLVEVVPLAGKPVHAGRHPPGLRVVFIKFLWIGQVRPCAHHQAAFLSRTLHGHRQAVQSVLEGRIRRQERRAARNPTDLVLGRGSGAAVVLQPESERLGLGGEPRRAAQGRHELIHRVLPIVELFEHLAAAVPRLHDAPERARRHHRRQAEDGQRQQ